MTEAPFTITVYDCTVGDGVIDEVNALYREIYAEPPYHEREEDFASFAEDLPRRVAQTNFRLVVGRRGQDPLGFALGHRLPATSSWWEGAETPLPAEVSFEYNGRTFAVIELAVRGPARHKGLGRKLHVHLLADLSEERTTLLVRPDAKPALTAYTNWNYRKVGRVRPHAGAPVYDAMVLARSPGVPY